MSGITDKESEEEQLISQQYVDHSYTDYSIVTEDNLRLLDENPKKLPPPANSEEANVRKKLKGMLCTYGPMKKNPGGVTHPFPAKVSSDHFILMYLFHTNSLTSVSVSSNYFKIIPYSSTAL